MCDYSLGEFRNRLAVEGEELILHRFLTGSMGLASPADLCSLDKTKTQKTFWQSLKSFFQLSLNTRSVPAVCVPPGAQLICKSLPKDLAREWGMTEEETENEMSVRFVQTSANVNQYRDALQLPNSRQVLLQDFPEGVRLQIVSLGGGVDTEQEWIAPTRLQAR